jgi:hypothetical protein
MQINRERGTVNSIAQHLISSVCLYKLNSMALSLNLNAFVFIRLPTGSSSVYIKLSKVYNLTRRERPNYIVGLSRITQDVFRLEAPTQILRIRLILYNIETI